MRPVAWSTLAQRDVARTYRYIAQFNPAAASRIANDLYAGALVLKQHPYAGRGISGGRRELIVGNYVLVYRVRTSETRILRVWHGAQDRPGPRPSVASQ